MSVAFILGTQKASSIDNIATLLENNKTKAIERIIDGDLETYINIFWKLIMEMDIQLGQKIQANIKLN